MADTAFYNNSRIGNDATDLSQRNLMNNRYTSRMLSNFVANNNDFVYFATQQPNVFYNGINGGSSVGANNIELDTQLTMKAECEGSVGKLQLEERPFITVPYLGRGSADPVLESQLLQGEPVSGKKSVKTISEQSYINYANYPLINEIKDTVTNPKYSVEEAAMDGWIRGGTTSRV
jgi:hypothetical protein